MAKKSRKTKRDTLAPKVRIIEERARFIHEKLLGFASRAFVIEFAGTPKAGKTTSVEAIRHFFQRQGFRVHVLIERASVCPIPMKGHLFFNTWCASTMLAELLANVDTETDIIIVDRGVFDALVWLTMQRQRDEVTEAEAKVIEDFLLLDRWRSLIDLAVVMNVSPRSAIARENSQRITPKLGSIMNPDVLSKISVAVQEAVKRYGPKFGAIIQHETIGRNIRASNVGLAEKILERLDTSLNPKILVVPKKVLEDLPLHQGGAFSESAQRRLLRCINEHGRYVSRADAEANQNYVQIVSCGLLFHNDDVFLFERKERDPKYKLFGQSAIWRGAHVPKAKGGAKVALTSALSNRLSQSLFLSHPFDLEFVGYCWEPNNSKSNQHLGVMFRAEISNEHTAADLRKKEFRHGRGHGLAGRFVPWKQIKSSESALKLEGWSKAVIQGFKPRLKSVKR
jgi:predicted NUDIX family phosphoesterase